MACPDDRKNRRARCETETGGDQPGERTSNGSQQSGGRWLAEGPSAGAAGLTATIARQTSALSGSIVVASSHAIYRRSASGFLKQLIKDRDDVVSRLVASGDIPEHLPK